MIMRAASSYLLGASLLSLSPAAVLAQPIAETDAEIVPDDGQLEQRVGVIVVTAQKREQNLQEVPLAVSALGSETIEQIGIEDAADISGLAPNVTVTQGTVSNTAAVLSIRGIPSGSQETFGLDLANGFYLDGIYIARASTAGLDVSDIQRIEVLRGPQGTLFGRNTTGGAIAFYSREPDNDLRLDAEAGYGSFDSWHAKIAIDPSEIAGIRTSFSYAHSERDGYTDNLLAPDDRDPGSLNKDTFRIAAMADVGETATVRYIFDYSKVDGVPGNFQLTNVADGSPNPPLVVDGIPVVTTQQAPVLAYLANATFLEPGCAALGTPTREWRDTVCLNSQGLSSDEIYGHNLQVTNDFGPVAVKFLTGYRFWNNDIRGSDLDGLGTVRGAQFTSASLFNGIPEPLLQFIPTIPAAARPFIAAAPVPTTTADLFSTTNRREHKQLSQEIELSGDADAFDWVLGGFYFWERGSENNPQTSAIVLDTNQIFFGNFGPLGPTLAAANPARYRAVVTPAILRYIATNESYAIYGQTTIYPGGRDSPFSFTAGGRYTWDDKKLVRFQNGVTPLDTPQIGDTSFSRFTWNLMGRYEFSPDVSAYARVATGYRSGGFNAQDNVIPGTSTIPSFDEETVTSYELGLKSEFFDRALRFNLAGYYNEYSDLVVIVPLDGPPGAFATRIDNAGSVTYTGVEAEFTAVLGDIFSVNGSVGYIDIDYNEFIAGRPVAGGAAVDVSSVVTPQYTSPLTANFAVNAQFDVGSARLTARVGYVYEDGKYSFNSVLAAPFNEEIRGDDRHLMDAQLTLDEFMIGNTEAEFQIWSRNLLDRNDLVRGIDFGQLGYAGGYFAPPRTFGALVRLKYQ